VKKTTTIFSVVLLAWVLAVSAIAAGPSALLNTTWVGKLSTVIRAADGNVTITTDNATLTFTGEKGTFLAGTITPLLGSPFDFTAIKEDDFLNMTAVDRLMSAEISGGHQGRKGHSRPPTMLIQGSGFTDGSMFLGTLTKQ